MAVHEHPQQHTGFHLPVRRRAGAAAVSGTAPALAVTSTGARVLAGIRVLTGFIFLWAFLDKAFGWGYATASGKGWVDGGSPTKGFLSGVSAGPMESTFHSWAGAGWANWLFMLGLLSIGVALTAGVALRFAAVAGTAMMALMWMAEWPPARHGSDGTLSMSSNPLVDYHLLYAAVMIALAVASAGTVWGLGRIWARLPVVRDHRWLL
ncbi:DoxX family membrane protein [Streptomyces sp. So13.3]|uniref:DoxX family membrane protein n=1 Tax=Streptomyces TaxID=1883 RepID=UPI0011057626|nr:MULTISPECIES: DoxX family membrane protein [Streptomyces]MCZ4097651.1 DoxX family membrane protein [Streptomyces sp. H39-C1]QNA76495.1 DoxX family membrane protein [Streptomyces sp. So13.3]